MFGLSKPLPVVEQALPDINILYRYKHMFEYASPVFTAGHTFMSSWEKRFFVLTPSALTYYTEEINVGKCIIYIIFASPTPHVVCQERSPPPNAKGVVILDGAVVFQDAHAPGGSIGSFG